MRITADTDRGNRANRVEHLQRARKQRCCVTSFNHKLLFHLKELRLAHRSIQVSNVQ